MKRILSVILCLALCLSLCACGKSEAVKGVESAISAIGAVTLDSGDAIAAAEEQYQALPEEEKADVENIADLEAARSTYDGLLVEDTVAKIDAIGSVTADSGDAITAARTAYDALPKELQNQVSNYDKLLSSEKDYEYIVFLDANMVKSYEPVDSSLADSFEQDIDEWYADNYSRAIVHICFHLQAITDDQLDSTLLHLNEQYIAINSSDDRIDLYAPYDEGSVIVFQYWPDKCVAQIGYAQSDLGIVEYLDLMVEAGIIDEYVQIPLSYQQEVLNMIS